MTAQIGKLGRDMKKWKIWEAMKEKVEQFRQTMPLIQDLKNPALRERHWDSLRSEVRYVQGGIAIRTQYVHKNLPGTYIALCLVGTFGLD